MAWKGALDLAGKPVHVKISPLRKSTRDPGFKILAKNGEPPVGLGQRDTDGKKIQKGETVKGVEHPEKRGEFVILSDKQMERIKNAGKTEVAEPAEFCPLSSIDLAQNTMSYSVVHDADVAGSFGPAQDLYRILKANDLAYVTQMILRGGGKDSIIAIYAKDNRLRAVAIPWQDGTYELPPGEFEDGDEARAKKVGAALGKKYKVADFEIDDFEYHWLERREAEILAAIEAGPDAEPEVDEPEETEATPEIDLMAALEDAIDEVKEEPAKKKPAKKGTTKKAKVST